ncbi:hypothetical protein [Brevibacterium luteolum]|uniref:hypothetical protein n=1 Tax=Brevibacterium luteolum TaxID=199591 RepID=UPI00223BF7BC|nr:hypothetical protein [Brevibacterium luteolum]MCT1873544.1 hypothetical protein [Brevibacterium luteolum]MCT1889861.1 hypothetical protein [Brevibacterium luteolum]MCT1892466.1 hypothetical protein [Brevibacterium luteolum]MCT1923241.1 hypothetical protein [Brevibacterium luteolum]
MTKTPEGWTPVPEPPERKNSPMVFIALGIAAIAVLGLVTFNMLSPAKSLTVASLNSPVVAALQGGSALYPANSKEALAEDVKFGYLPAVDLARTADGTLVLADPDAEPQALGLDRPVDETDDATFAEAAIAPAPGSERTGTTLTWAKALEDFGSATVLMPAVDADTIRDVIATAEETGRTDGIIVRSDDPAVLKQAGDAGLTALFDGEAQGPDAVEAPMAAVAADAENLDEWFSSDVQTWVTGVATEKQLGELAAAGAYGALADNPFTIQPSAVKTD